MKKVLIYSIFFIISLAVPALSQKATLPEGYGDMKWTTSLEDALKAVRGKVTFTDNQKVIYSRDGDIQYQYGFFYREPEPASGTATTPATPPSSSDKPAETKPSLFYVSVGFPYLILDTVRSLMKERYGEPTGETLKDNRGALVWDSEKTMIVLWVDSYEKKPYCRRITYVSKDMAQQVTDYQNRVFNKREIEILKNLKP